MLLSSPSAFLAVVITFTSQALAHDHHHGEESKIPEGETVSPEPLDTILWLHIFLQTIAYGVIFPTGMVFGLVRSRWHVPTQILGTALAIVGFFLGHAHSGREFTENNVHATFAHVLQIMLAAQVVLGLYLKGHWERGLNGRLRRFVRPCHSLLGKAMPILSWTQILFGGITALGFCQGGHLGQCAAHFIMGSAFIAYGIVLTIILLVGQLWMRHCGRSQEFFDSAVIAVWGCVNTFTEHRWGSEWGHNDWQHTTMGIVWWCGGLAGIWLSRDRDGRPKRNFIPGLILILTGWAMSAHPQDLMASAATHSVFGYTLMAAGLSRIIEVSFILKDENSADDCGRSWNSFQYVPIFLLYAAGFLFMGATEEQMALVTNSPMDHISYILILYSIAFMVFLFTNILISLYDRLAHPGIEDKDVGNGNGNAYTIANGSPLEEGRVGDAEEFELGDMTTDEEREGEEDEERKKMLKRNRNGRANGNLADG